MNATPKHYVLTWLALVSLAILSFALAGAELGRWSTPIALAIGGLKAWLIATFFMHLSRGPVSARLAVTVSVAFIVLLASLMAADIWTRDPV